MIRFIHDIHVERASQGRPAISFEFFPPKTEEGDRNLLEKTLPELLKLQPDYCSVTYGAGGGTRQKTIAIVDQIQKRYDLTTMMHLTCVSATRAELHSVIEEARERGVKNLLALRGDPPGGSGEWIPTDGGFRYSSELVKYLHDLGGFNIGTAGFPEGHIACREGKFVDWGHLADKVKAGADFIVTQLFFDNADYYQFREYLTAKLGVQVPIIPGILPVVARNQTKKFVALCGAQLPKSFLQRLEELGDDDAAVTRFGIDYATEQCADLLRQGAPGIHFYTLNKAHSTAQIVRNLRLT